ncbi:MAG: low molecular weight protein arginine phosphatase [Acidimicrobiia bacterium]|nr:low molecular weight protein arginine phosphatase [Acidimicrobiia bacterium]
MIVFVCTGNICRSPMAEGLARALRPDLEFSSAGIHPVLGSPPTQHAQAVVAETDHDIADLRATAVPTDAELALCMTQQHVDWMRVHRPQIPAELLRLDGGEVADPYGADIDTYRSIRDEIDAAIRERFSQSE